MLTENDKQLLAKLKKDNPEAYDFFLRREAEHRELLKTGCHDIRNIVTLLSGSYQLLGLTNPQLNSIPRFTRMGDDIKSLVKAFNDIALYRYAGTVSLASSHLSALESSIRQNISEEHTDMASLIELICENPDAEILTDTAKLAGAAGCMITNAIEACDYNGSSSAPIMVYLCVNTDSTITVRVSNRGSAPASEVIDKMFTPFCSDKQEHLGLGLAIAAETADALGGSIAYSHEADITSFELRVPAVSELEALV